MTLIVARDAIHDLVSKIPRPCVGMGYVDGDPAVKWTPADWLLFPQHLTTTTVPPGANAQIADVESGDFKPTDIPGWIFKWNLKKPVAYCTASTLVTLRGMNIPNLRFFVADPQPINMPAGTPHMYPGNDIVGTQYLWTPGYDESWILSDFWFPPPPIILGEEKMRIIRGNPSGREAIFSDETLMKKHMGFPATITGFIATGVPVAEIDDNDFDTIKDAY